MTLAYFPTPYPDETIYSVICRLHLRLGRPSYYALGRKLIGGHLSLNTPAPHGIGQMVSLLPKKTGLTVMHIINKTTILPYFSPFLSEERKGVFLNHMLGSSIAKGDTTSSFGT